MLELFRDVHRYRELIWVLASKELKVRYKRSILGFVWALLHPLLMMTILTIVFSAVLRVPVDNYAIFLLCTLFPWTFFSQSMAYSTDCIVNNADLLKVGYLPKLVLPVAAVLANLINFLLSFVPLALLLAVFDFPFHKTLLYLPIPVLALALFALGCGFFTAAVNVYFRDVTHIVQILLAAWFYFSPIIYSLEFLPVQYHKFFRLNPMLYILDGFRHAIYYGELPSALSIGLSLACGMIALGIGFGVFRRYQDSFVFNV